MPKKYKTVKECLDKLDQTKANPAVKGDDRDTAFEDLFEIMGISKQQCPGGQLIAR